jgi:hypothetical protein
MQVNMPAIRKATLIGSLAHVANAILATYLLHSFGSTVVCLLPRIIAAAIGVLYVLLVGRGIKTGESAIGGAISGAIAFAIRLVAIALISLGYGNTWFEGQPITIVLGTIVIDIVSAAALGAIAGAICAVIQNRQPQHHETHF